jgi:hypothetical protein
MLDMHLNPVRWCLECEIAVANGLWDVYCCVIVSSGVTEFARRECCNLEDEVPVM